MAVVVIPFVPSQASYSFDTSIADVAYTFDVRWNMRDEAWFFDLFEADGNRVVSGVKIVLGTYLGRTSRHTLFKDGVLAAIDTSGALLDAGFDDLGTRVEVRYYPSADLVTEAFGS